MENSRDTGIGWAAKNLANVLANPTKPSAEELALTDAALARLEARKDEDPEVWARELAAKFATYGD